MREKEFCVLRASNSGEKEPAEGSGRIYAVAKIKGISQRYGIAPLYLFGTYARRKAALQSDMDVKILSRLLGHANVNITYNIYVHLYGDEFDEMYAALVSEK